MLRAFPETAQRTTVAMQALPVIHELHAPAAWQCIDFISDLHLADDTPQGFAAWQAYLNRTAADAVFILGDLFDVWVGDDARGEIFEARCVDVLRRASARLSVAFMAGNRDFLVGQAMLADGGMQALVDPTVLVAFGQRALLTHGDALCLADVEYQHFRAQVRNAARQADFLSRPLAERRHITRHIRAESERRHTVEPSGVWFDIDAAEARRWMAAADAPTLIHGHTHHPGTETLAPRFTRHVLSDWELDHGTAARAEVLRWQRDGMHRLKPSDAAATAT